MAQKQDSDIQELEICRELEISQELENFHCMFWLHFRVLFPFSFDMYSWELEKWLEKSRYQSLEFSLLFIRLPLDK